MKRAPLLLLLLAPAPLCAQRDSLDALERMDRVAAERASLSEPFYGYSPVGELYRPTPSLSQLDLRLQLRREEEARLEPLGDGALDGGIYAESYLRLDPQSAVRADARYVRGGRSNIRWNSTADYLLLYPYITADSIGGDLTTEEYAFGGGYTRRLGRFAVALRGDYRSGQEYRQVDPRPHNVVSDFTLRAGGGFEWPHHVLLADFEYRIYRQNQRIAFQNETHIVRELFMTGLGSYLPRYSGKSSSTTVAYVGRGIGAALQYMPRTGSGWYARAAWKRFTADRNFRPNNSIPVSRLTTGELKAEVVYRAARWSAAFHGSFGQRLGTEMVADRNGQGSIVDRQALYENRTQEFGAEAAAVWHRGAARYVLRPSVEWSTSTARYLLPRREMTVSQLGAALRAEASWRLDGWRLAATAGAGYFVAPRRGVRLDGLADYLAEYLTRTAARLNSRHLDPEASLRAERLLRNRTACFAEVRYAPRLYRDGVMEHQLTAACGLLF